MAATNVQRRTPDALIIGAMKSGTTGLAKDLAALQGFFCPPVKEPEDLCHDAVLGGAGLERYLRLFSGAAPDLCAFEASTAYTKRPLYEGVAARAKALLRPDLRLVYMVREPLARAKSQLKHEAIILNANRSGAQCVFDRAALARLGVVAFSDYEYQLAPWIEGFGTERLRLVRFEDYAADRIGTLASIAAFLAPGRIDRAAVAAAIDTGVVHNPSEGRLEPQGLVGRFVLSDVYLRYIKGIIPAGLRGKLKRGLSKEVNTAYRTDGFDIAQELRALQDGYPDFLARHAAILLAPVGTA